MGGIANGHKRYRVGGVGGLGSGIGLGSSVFISLGLNMPKSPIRVNAPRLNAMGSFSVLIIPPASGCRTVVCDFIGQQEVYA